MLIKSLALSLATHGYFSPLKVQVFLMKFVSKEAHNSNIVTAIFNSTQQASHVSATSFRPKDFVQMAFDKPFHLTTSLGCGQTCSKLENGSIEDSEVDDRLEKNRFC